YHQQTLPQVPPSQAKHIQPAMSLFKSNKNKTASAATTPTQTPRTSLNEQRPETKMTQEQAIKMVMKKTVQAPGLSLRLM
ncbi:hypothetical protein BGZ47_004600, partial [Haplosporangium gracile]